MVKKDRFHYDSDRRPVEITAGEHVPFDEARQEQYLRVLQETGERVLARHAAGVHKNTVKYKREHDPEFAFKEKEAFELYKAEQIVVEIQRRAIKGIDEPIYWKGKIVGYTRKFSDKLLLALAKRHIDGFKDHLKVDQKTELSGAVEVSMDVLGQFDEESLRDMKRILAREAARKSQPEEDD